MGRAAHVGQHRWTVDDITALLRAAYRDVQGPLTLSVVRQWGRSRGRVVPAQRTFTVRFGSWSASCEAAGVPHANSIGAVRPGPRPVDTDRCWAALAAFLERCEREQWSPTLDRYQLLAREEGWPARNTLRLRLGLAWPELLREAKRRNGGARSSRGGDSSPEGAGAPGPTHHRRLRSRPPSASDIVAALRRAAVDRGGRLTTTDYRAWAATQPDDPDGAIPPVDAIRARFGSWAAACRAAGLVAGRDGWTDAGLIAALRAGYAEIGEPFTASRFATWSGAQPAPTCHLAPDTCIHAFGSWTTCQLLAGAKQAPIDALLAAVGTGARTPNRLERYRRWAALERSNQRA